MKQDLKRCILGEHKLNTTGGEKQRAEAIERRMETGSERLRGRQMEGEHGKTWRLIKGEEGTETGRGRKAKTCRMHPETGKNELEENRRFFQRKKSSSAPQGQNDPLHFPVFASLPFFQLSLSLYISLSDGRLPVCSTFFIPLANPTSSHSFSPAPHTLIFVFLWLQCFI